MENLSYLGVILLIYLLGAVAALLIWYWFWIREDIKKYIDKRKQARIDKLVNTIKANSIIEPKVIVVREGPPKRSSYDILTKPMPMPKWKPVENILTPVTVPRFDHLEDIAMPKLTKTINNKDIKLKKPKTADQPKRRNRGQCKRSSRP